MRSAARWRKAPAPARHGAASRRDRRGDGAGTGKPRPALVGRRASAPSRPPSATSPSPPRSGNSDACGGDVPAWPAHYAPGNYGRSADLLWQIVALAGRPRERTLRHDSLPVGVARSWLAWTLAERENSRRARRSARRPAYADAAGDLYSRARRLPSGLGTLYLAQGSAEEAIQVLEKGLVIARLENISFLVPFIIGPLRRDMLAGQPERGLPARADR